MQEETFMEKTDKLFAKAVLEPDNKLLYRNQIVELNLRLVHHVLKKYRPFTEDQYQAGCMGLILATNTYNKEKDVPFSSYACFCIERELHKMYRYNDRLFETNMQNKLLYLDAKVRIGRGDQEVSIEELIPDIIAEEDFARAVEDMDLCKLFDIVVNPAINDVADNTRGQNMKIDINEWKKLEARYLLELATDHGTQKSRFNLSQMAKKLKISAQNTRNRHIRVINFIQKKYRERYHDK